MSSIYAGSSFDDFLEDEQIAEEVSTEAILRVVAWLLKQEMQEKGISKTRMAQKMGTSRAQLDRILNGETPNIGINTLARAARSVNRELVLELK